MPFSATFPHPTKTGESIRVTVDYDQYAELETPVDYMQGTGYDIGWFLRKPEVFGLQPIDAVECPTNYTAPEAAIMEDDPYDKRISRLVKVCTQAEAETEVNEDDPTTWIEDCEDLSNEDHWCAAMEANCFDVYHIGWRGREGVCIDGRGTIGYIAAKPEHLQSIEGYLYQLSALREGEVYYIVKEESTTCPHCGDVNWAVVETSSGYIGHDHTKDGLQELFGLSEEQANEVLNNWVD